MEKIKLLPNEIYSFTYPDIEDFLKIKKNLHKENFIDEKIPEDWGRTTSNNFLHKEKVYSKLFDWIHSCIDKVTKLEGYDCDSLKVCQSWGNKMVPGQRYGRHFHLNSIISGIFYFSESSPTTFFVNNSWYIGFPAPISLHGNEKEYFCQEIENKSCQLLLFPSSMIHGVRHESTNERYTIAFNTWIDGHWGNDNTQNGVNTKVL